MNPCAAVSGYVQKIVSSESGLKVLLLDDETARIISVVTTQTDLLKNDVILTEKLSKKRKTQLPHLSAIVFIRPTAENVFDLRTELRNAHFSSYNIVFSNTVRRTFIEEIADADEHELVSQVSEYFADYYALDNHLISLNVIPFLDTLQGRGSMMQNPSLERTIDGMLAVMLSSKRKPQIRYHATSPICRNLAERLCVRMDQEGSLLDFRSRESQSLLLILDRREDPVTPLLNQWTYEAMVHELVEIAWNRVSLLNAPNVPPDCQELVLNASEDEFYRQNRYINFGDLGNNLKDLVDEFRSQSKGNSSTKTIQDMMRFVSNFPEFRKSSVHVAKHVAIAGELSRLVGQTCLLEVSELEQDLACREAEAEHRAQIMDIIKKPNVTGSDKLRLVMLYSLRYEATNDGGLPMMKDALHRAGLGSDAIHLITSVKEYAGASKRSGDVFSNKTFFARASTSMKRGLGGVENVYTQHEPLLVQTMDDLFRGKLKSTEYPLARPDSGQVVGIPDDNAVIQNISPPKEVIILIAGGATYEESKCISAINGGPNAFVPPEGTITASATQAARQENARVLLVGTGIHNSTSFAVEITRNANVQREAQLSRPIRG